MLDDSPALSRVQNVILQTVKLQPCRDDFSKQLADGVQEADGAKSLRDIVSWLIGLGNDDTSRLFEPCGPDAARPDLIEQVADAFRGATDLERHLQQFPGDAVGAGRQTIAGKGDRVTNFLA